MNPRLEARKRLVAAVTDLVAGLRASHIWLGLSWLDIRQRYRRTLLGPFWVTVGFALSVAALGLVWSTMFKIDVGKFLPYLSAGLATWMFISMILTEGCNTFTWSSALIQQYRMPLSVHAYRLVSRNLIVYAHNLVVVVGAGLLLGVQHGAVTLLAIPALVLLVLNATWVAIFLGTLSLRFRDLAQVVAVLVNMAFLVTPIFWYKHLLGARGHLVDWNPLYHVIEVVRAPLIGELPDPTSWVVVGCITAVGWIATVGLFARCRRWLPYWV